MAAQQDIVKLHYIANIRVPTEMAHGVQIFSMCEALSNHFDTTLVVPIRKNTIKGEPFSYYSVQKIFSIVAIPAFFKIPINNKLLFLLQAASFSITSLFHSCISRPQYVYTRSEGIAFVHSFFLKNVVLEIHTKKEGFLYRTMVRRIKKIIVISEGLREHLISLGCNPERCLVAHDGVCFEKIARINKGEMRKKFGFSLNQTVIGYIGKYKTMGVEKGVAAIAAAIAATKIPNCLFLFVGVSDYEMNEVINAITETGISQFKIVPHILHEEALEYMVASDILIMNYPDTEHYRRYMSPLKLFEYLATGNGIITTDLPVIREIVSEKEVWFVKPGDSQMLELTIASMIETVQGDNPQGSAARLLAEQYSWKGRAGNITHFISI